MDEKANIFKVRYLYGEHGRICGGHRRERGCVLPGEVCQPAMCYRHSVIYHDILPVEGDVFAR
jgi:hypothetical protein